MQDRSQRKSEGSDISLSQGRVVLTLVRFGAYNEHTYCLGGQKRICTSLAFERGATR